MPPVLASASPALPTATALRNPVGTHVKIGKGLVAGAFAQASEIGAEAIQIFAGNPRGWASSAGDPQQDKAFRAACEQVGMRVFIHSPYLVNVGSPTPATYEKSVACVAHNLRRATELGAEGVVVHTGSCVAEGSVEAAMRQVREGFLPILDALGDSPDGGPLLLLEPTAGQGRSLCAGVDDLEAYLTALEFHPRAGICLDTCHVFAAGAPLDEPGGMTATVDRLVEIGGKGRLRLVHANDSMDVRGAFKDRHQKIGQGHIGTEAFAELFAHPATDGVPFVLETPGSRDVHDPDIALLKKLRDGMTSERRNTLLAALALLAMTACWGSTFYLIKDLLDRVPVLDFLAVRFAVASVALILLAPKALGRLSAAHRKHAVVLGLLYGLAQILQTAGLAHTPASVSGFITGMYVVCTPLLAAALLHTRITRVTWGAVALATVGLGVLTLEGFSVGYGEAITLVAAVLYALHIVGLGAWTNAREAMGMTIVQLIVITVVCFVATVPDGIVLPSTTGDWISVIYMAVFAGALALAGQTWAQAHLPPTRSAIIMSMEPVFAAFFAVLLGGELLTGRMLLGGALVLTAMLVVELVPRRRIETEVPHIAV